MKGGYDHARVKRAGGWGGKLRHTLTYPPDVLGAGWIPKGPVIHLDLCALRLGLPHGIQKHIYRTLSWCLRPSIEHRHAQHHAQALLSGLCVLPEHGNLTIELGLAVEVRGPRRSVILVGGVTWSAGEDVVSGDVDDQDIPAGCELGEGLARSYVERSGAFRVFVDLVWEALCGT